LEVDDSMDQSTAQRGHEPQAAGQPAIPLEVIRDRYEGMLVCTRPGEYPHKVAKDSGHVWIGDYNKLQMDLDGVIRALVEGTTRTPQEQWQTVDLIDECETLLREHIIRRVHETGIAR
jgi:hypothetical protein